MKKDPARGTWMYVVDLPPGPDNQRRQKLKRGFSTRRAAEEALAEVIGRVNRGIHADAGRRRLSEYLEEWLEGLAVSRENSTVENYGNVLRSWVIPRIGGLRLSAVEPGHLRKLYAELLKEGGRGGRPLSARSVSLAHRVLHRALEDAVSDGLLPRNPAASVKRPAVSSSAAGAVWSAEDARRFLAAVTGERLEALWRLELNTGLRRAEAAGLRWSDVDFSAGVIQVRVQRTTEGYKVVEREPKTAAGRRRVPVDPGAMAALRAWRTRQKEERLAFGPAYQDTDLVFTREDGSGWHPQSLRHALTWACKRAGVPVLRYHDLRHTAATLALEAGVHPKVVQERLGHASVQITLDTYSHVQESVAKDAADRIARYLGGDG
ncbi:MAG: site-specific integrase [Actinomycetota bacterium]